MPDSTTPPTSDDERMMALLWRSVLGDPAGSRGPKQRRTVDEVVDAGVAIADEHGLEALTMRRLADALGLGVMSIYSYVPGRDELIWLMIDRVAAEQGLPPHPERWRDRLKIVAQLRRDECLRHPWLLYIEISRGWIGPNLSDRYEWQLAAIDGIGLDDIEMDQTSTLIDSFAVGNARAAHEARRVREITGTTDAEWWATAAPLLERVMAGRDYPVSGRVGQAAGAEYDAASDPDRAFRFGVDLILDGVELLLRRTHEPDG